MELVAYNRLDDPVRRAFGEACRIDSCMDFQVRVFLIPLVLQYKKLRGSMTSPAKTAWHKQWLPLVVRRFADLAPAHPMRNVPPESVATYFNVSAALPAVRPLAHLY